MKTLHKMPFGEILADPQAIEKHREAIRTVLGVFVGSKILEVRRSAESVCAEIVVHKKNLNVAQQLMLF